MNMKFILQMAGITAASVFVVNRLSRKPGIFRTIFVG